MKKTKNLAVVIGLVINIPIWLYLLYKILEAVGASELMWFLYWVYIPAHILVVVLMRIAEAKDDK